MHRHPCHSCNGLARLCDDGLDAAPAVDVCALRDDRLEQLVEAHCTLLIAAGLHSASQPRLKLLPTIILLSLLLNLNLFVTAEKSFFFCYQSLPFGNAVG